MSMYNYSSSVIQDKNIESQYNSSSEKEVNTINEKSLENINIEEDYLVEGMDLLKSIEMIQEFEAEGQQQTEEDTPDENYNIDDGVENGNEETQNNNQTDDDTQDEDYNMDDEAENDQQQDQNTENQDQENNEEEQNDQEDENYEIPDEEETTDGEEADNADEDYNMDDAEGDDGNQTENTDEETPTDTDVAETPDTKLKELETVVFDNLTDEEKKLKIKELKSLFIEIHKRCETIADRTSDLKTDEETIQISEYISNVLLNLKMYISDYLNNIFDSKTYVENLAHLQKYITIFSAINKVFDDIKREN